jgi:hypothetical protein
MLISPTCGTYDQVPADSIKTTDVVYERRCPEMARIHGTKYERTYTISMLSGVPYYENTQYINIILENLNFQENIYISEIVLFSSITSQTIVIQDLPCPPITQFPTSSCLCTDCCKPLSTATSH